MIVVPWSTYLVVGLLAVFQFLLGVSIGVWWLRRDRREPDLLVVDAMRLRNLAERLGGVTAEVRNEVCDSQRRLNDVVAQLTCEAQRTGDSSLTDPLAEILQLNEQLHHRLCSAEDRLTDQAAQIDVFVSESRCDALTGLPNRRALDDELLRRYAAWKRRPEPLSLMMIDIDHFKRLNDTYGHPAGDRVLQDIARVFRGTARTMDLIARYGGEKFAMVMPQTNLRDAARAAERVLHAVRTTALRADAAAAGVTVSVGVAQLAAGDDISSILRRADEALYAAKRAGRDVAHLHDGRTTISLDELPAAGATSDSARPAPSTSPPEANATLAAASAELRDGLRETTDR